MDGYSVKSAACIIFTRAKLPDRQRLPSARVRIQRALRSFRDAKPSFLWKDARDPRFDSERNGHGVPFTSLVGGQLSFW